MTLFVSQTQDRSMHRNAAQVGGNQGPGGSGGGVGDVEQLLKGHRIFFGAMEVFLCWTEVGACVPVGLT